MPEATETPTDARDALYDADRGDCVRVILEALKDGFLEPRPISQSHMSDYGSSAGLVYDRLTSAGFKIVRG